MTNLSEFQKKYVEAFIESAVFVLKKEVGIEFKKNSVTIKNSPMPGLPFCVSIGFSDTKMKGQVVYSMTLDIAEKIAKLMMPNKLPIEQKKYINSCIGEISNMISGRVTINIATEDHVMNITPPTVFRVESKNGLVIDFLTTTTLSLILDSTLGSFEINIAFKSNGE